MPSSKNAIRYGRGAEAVRKSVLRVFRGQCGHRGWQEPWRCLQGLPREHQGDLRRCSDAISADQVHKAGGPEAGRFACDQVWCQCRKRQYHPVLIADRRGQDFDVRGQSCGLTGPVRGGHGDPLAVPPPAERDAYPAIKFGAGPEARVQPQVHAFVARAGAPREIQRRAANQSGCAMPMTKMKPQERGRQHGAWQGCQGVG